MLRWANKRRGHDPFRQTSTLLWHNDRGGIFTVISPITAELFGIRSHGALFGIVAFSGTVGGAAGPILAGLVFDMTGSYQLIFMALIGLAAVSLLLTLPLRPARS